MYAVYHGPRGLRAIAERINDRAHRFAAGLRRRGFEVGHEEFFDTVRVELGYRDARKFQDLAAKHGCNLREFTGNAFGVSLDETTSDSDLEILWQIFEGDPDTAPVINEKPRSPIPESVRRSSEYLTHPVFNTHHTETEMLRYLRRLESRDLSLTTSMIPLGSCTMKLNATAEMFPISWPEPRNCTPFHGEQRLVTANVRPTRDWLAKSPACGGLSPTERRLARRIRRAARNPRVSCHPWRRGPQGVSHPDLRPRHQPGKRGHGGVQSRAGGLLEGWRHRSRRSAREGGHPQDRPCRIDGHLSIHAWRVRDDHSRDLRNRSLAWRPGLHGWREHECPGWSLPPSDMAQTFAI